MKYLLYLIIVALIILIIYLLYIKYTNDNKEHYGVYCGRYQTYQTCSNDTECQWVQNKSSDGSSNKFCTNNKNNKEAK